MSAVEAPDRRAVWLDWRRQGVGASDVAAILGISPWGSPWSVWADKCGLLADRADNEMFEFGRWAELMIGPWFEQRTGLYISGEQTLCVHRTEPTHRCTVDGFVGENPGLRVTSWPLAYTDGCTADDLLGCFEIKTAPFGHRWDEIPAHYQTQGQWQMHVTNMERCWFAVLHGKRLEIYELDRDQADIDLMVDRVDRFWAEHVVTGAPPPVDQSEATAAALGEVYPGDDPDGVDLDDVLIRAWAAAKVHLSEAEARVTGLSNTIKAELGNHQQGLVDGHLAVTWKPQTRKGFDAARLKADHPQIHAEYATESDPFRVLRAKES